MGAARSAAASIGGVLRRLPLHSVVHRWVRLWASLHVRQFGLNLYLQVLHAGDVLVHQTAAVVHGDSACVLHAQSGLLQLILCISGRFALFDEQLIAFVLVWHRLARSRWVRRPHGRQVLIVLVPR